MRYMIYILMIVLLCITVVAEQDKVYVLNLEYDNGQITIIEKTLKYGYAPDRISEGDHALYVMDEDENILESFKFEVPLEVYTDLYADGRVEGGVELLDKTNFSLIVPYYADGDKIVIYGEESHFLASEDINEEKSHAWIWITGIILLVLLAAFFIIRRRNQS